MSNELKDDIAELQAKIEQLRFLRGTEVRLESKKPTVTEEC